MLWSAWVTAAERKTNRRVDTDYCEPSRPTPNLSPVPKSKNSTEPVCCPRELQMSDVICLHHSGSVCLCMMMMMSLCFVCVYRGSVQCCSLCYPLCIFIVLAACVMACAGLIWMQISLKQDLDSMKEKMRMSEFTSLNVMFSRAVETSSFMLVSWLHEFHSGKQSETFITWDCEAEWRSEGEREKTVWFWEWREKLD